MKRNQLLYGAGATGKSTRLAEASEYMWKVYKKKTRVVNADGGGTRSAFQHLIDHGVAEVWDVDLWAEQRSIFDLLDLATKGWWPVDVEVPGSQLVASVQEFRKCPSCAGRLESSTSTFSTPKSCSTCGQNLGSGVLPVSIRTMNPPDLGLVCFEGLTAFGELMLRRLRNVDSSGGNSIKDGDYKVSSPGQQHYGMAQSYTAQFVSNSRQLPVDLVIWTALELRADEDGKPLYGPALPGKALTAKCIPWFTDVLHLDMLPKKNAQGVVEKKDGIEVVERKLYLMPHFPPDNPIYKFAAKTSAPMAGKMPVVLDADMRKFYIELEAAHVRARASLQE